VINETEDDLIERLNEWKDNVENRCIRVSMNKTKVMISGEWQTVTQKAVRWPCGVCGRGIYIIIESCLKRLLDISSEMARRTAAKFGMQM